jgi:DNA replication protein DnaC
MLIHPTVERLRSLGLAAMADTLIELQNNPEAAEMPHADWLGLLIDREATFRDNRRLSRRLTAARLRQAATIENIDYRTSRGLDRALFQTLATSQWVRDQQPLGHRRSNRHRKILACMRPREQGLPRRLFRPL